MTYFCPLTYRLIGHNLGMWRLLGGGLLVDESCLPSSLNQTRVCSLVRQGGRKEAQSGVGFHEDSLAALKHSIYVSD